MKHLLISLATFSSVYAMNNYQDYEASSKDKAEKYASFVRVMEILESQEEKELLGELAHRRNAPISPIVTAKSEECDPSPVIELTAENTAVYEMELSPTITPTYRIMVQEDDSDFIMLNREDFED